jgi:branched-chain amino acid transport system substrate-binding protein
MQHLFKCTICILILGISSQSVFAQNKSAENSPTQKKGKKASNKGVTTDTAIVINNIPQAPIIIGMCFVESDPLDLPQLRATQMAIGEINNAGGIMGRKLNLIAVSSLNRNYDKFYIALKAVIDSGATCIIIPDGSDITMKAANMTVVKDVLMMATSSTSPDISMLKDNDLVWRTAASDVFQGHVIAELLDSMKLKTAAVIHIDNNYGNGLFTNFQAVYTKRGGTITNVVKYAPKQSYREVDFKLQLDTLYATKPQAVYIISDIEDGIKITMQSQMYGFITKEYKPQFVGCDANYSNDFLQLVNPSIIDGMIGLSYVRPKNNPIHEKFLARFKQFLRDNNDSSNYTASVLDGLVDTETIDTYASTSYDAAYLLAFAIANGKSTASGDIAKNLRLVANTVPQSELVNAADFSKAIGIMQKGKRINYNGVSSAIEFDDKGDVTSGSYTVWRVSKGRYTVARTISFP